MSSSSAAKPALDAAKLVESSLITEVRELGHYPKRHKRPADDAQRAENSLAKRLAKSWDSLPEEQRDILEEMRRHSAAKPEATSLVDMVRELGRYP